MRSVKLKVELAQIYGSNYIKITASHNRTSLLLQINEAEELWQELMIKCKEYRMIVKDEVKQ